ncbi:MAG TPA: FGGY family carbohydrate kinase [Mycobacteriales bacterium]|nr:FGGY family carbohydrate kinase [Mycobacteriales bacterium]
MTGERVLTLDLGTSAVKATLWQRDGIVARGRAPVVTRHPEPGWAEQDADSWLAAVQGALGDIALDGVRALAFSSQRETAVCCHDDGTPLRPAILWSDTRPEDWVERVHPELWARTAWLAYPRDWVLHALTGVRLCDPSIALLARDEPRERIAPIAPSTTVAGSWDGIPVVLGGGDRACEVHGTGATAGAPMLSWGTTANVTVPGAHDVSGGRRSTGLHGEPLTELGLAGAGSALGWLAALTGVPADELTRLAADAPPAHARALPYLNGARAPHWRPDVRATFAGLDLTCGPGALARALYEGVAHDVRRCLEKLDGVTELNAAGGGADDAVWRTAVPAITRRALQHRATSEAASAGAALLAAEVVGLDWSRDELNPLAARDEPDVDLVAAYAVQAAAHDALLARALS